MKFISQVTDSVTGDIFASIDEISLSIDRKKISVLLNSFQILPHYPFFLGIDAIKNSRGDLLDLPNRKTLISIVDQIVCWRKPETEIDDVLRKYFLELVDATTAEHTAIVDKTYVSYTTYLPITYFLFRDGRFKSNKEIFAVLFPYQLNHYNFSDSEVFLKVSEISQFTPEDSLQSTEPQKSHNEEIPLKNTIKKKDEKTFQFTFNGEPSEIKGKGVPIIVELLLNKGKEFEATYFTRPGAIIEANESDYDHETMVEESGYSLIKLTEKDKRDHQKMVDAYLPQIKDLQDELLSAPENEHDEINSELSKKQSEYKQIQQYLQTEFKAWVDDAGKVRYRIDKESGTIRMMQRKYKNEIDGVRKLIKTTINRKIKDEPLRTHLDKCIKPGEKIRYQPDDDIIWELIPTS